MKILSFVVFLILAISTFVEIHADSLAVADGNESATVRSFENLRKTLRLDPAGEQAPCVDPISNTPGRRQSTGQEIARRLGLDDANVLAQSMSPEAQNQFAKEFPRETGEGAPELLTETDAAGMMNLLNGHAALLLAGWTLQSAPQKENFEANSGVVKSPKGEIFDVSCVALGAKVDVARTACAVPTNGFFKLNAVSGALPARDGNFACYLSSRNI